MCKRNNKDNELTGSWRRVDRQDMKFAPERRTAYAASAILLAALAGCVCMLPVFREELQSYLGIGDRRFGLLFSIIEIAGIVPILTAAVLIKQKGPQAIIRLCLIGVAISMMMITLSNRFWIILSVALGLYGVFVYPLYIAVTTYLVQLFPQRKRRVLALLMTVVSISRGIYSCVAEMLLYISQTTAVISFAMVLHAPFLVIGLIFLLANFLYRRKSEPAATGDTLEQLRIRNLLLPTRQMIIVGLLGLHGAGDIILYVWMARFLGSSSFTTMWVRPGLVLAGFSAVYILSRSLLAFIPEHRGRRALMVLPGIVGGTVCIVGILSRSSVWTPVLYVAGAFLFSVEYPVMLSNLAYEKAGHFSTAMALQMIAVGVFSFVGLNLIGQLVAVVGETNMWKVMLIPASLFPFIGICAGLWQLRYGTKKWKSSETTL